MYYKHCFKVEKSTLHCKLSNGHSHFIWELPRKELNISECVFVFVVKRWFKRVWLVSSAVEIMYTYLVLFITIYASCTSCLWMLKELLSLQQQLSPAAIYLFPLLSMFAAGAGLGGESTNEISWRKTSSMVVTVMCI